MGQFGGFYKGEKKKQKKNSDKITNVSVSTRPIFVAPKMVEKKKKAA